VHAGEGWSKSVAWLTLRSESGMQRSCRLRA